MCFLISKSSPDQQQIISRSSADQQQIISRSSAGDLLCHITAPVNHCFPELSVTWKTCCIV